jgi:pimeloyl-ACP methyl ester carboxylesterase
MIEEGAKMHPLARQRLRLSGGSELSFITAGEASNPALLLLHGFPSSARMFSKVAAALSQVAYVACLDLASLMSCGSAEYLARWQPPSLMLWGRHDAFFDLAEVLSWMRALPRMEAHVLDASHLLLETHAAPAASLMLDFIRRAPRLEAACSPA